MLEELETLRDVIAKLEASGVPYMITGSMAMSYYAIPRMTRDIDFVIELRPEQVGNFVSQFENEYYIDPQTVLESVQQERMFNLIHNRTSMKVDCIIRKRDPYEEIKFARRELRDLGGLKAQVISAEDLILSKLLWAKDSLSEVQFRDVKNMLSSCEDLDREYLRSWAKSLSIDHLLNNFLPIDQ